MAVCYVEVFLLRNALCDAMLLYAVSLWHGGRIRPKRIALGAACGAAFALAAAMTGGVLRSLPSQGIASVLMVRLGIGRAAPQKTAMATAALWAGAMLIGGAAALGLSVSTASAATGCAGVALLRRKNAPPPPTVQVMIRQGLLCQTIEAIVDTGNRALDPFTCLPVVFIPEGLFTADAGRLISIRTAAGARLLPCFQPDELTIDGIRAAAVVAMSRDRLPGALVPHALCAERSAA